jgi:ribosomal-protein-alanine N-acetyltransferase
MNFYIETERLILRNFLPRDVEGIYELDAHPEVHRYLGNKPITSMQQAHDYIANVTAQYKDNGIGRWAAIEKSTGDFIGWAGLKHITYEENGHINFYDVGYRLIPRYWGKGYATEAAKAALEYGFNTLGLNEIIGMCHEHNTASRRALEKCGLRFIEKFKWNDITCDWLKITKHEWSNGRLPVN